MTTPEQITAVILAGGRGSRMGGVDKGLVEWNNRPLISYAIDAILPQVGGLIINANRSIEHYETLGYPIVSDELVGFQGPLAGFLTGLQHVDTPYAMFIPCDTPKLAGNLVSRLCDGMDREQSEISVAHDGRRLQPVCALIHTRLRHHLESYLLTGERKIDRWYAQHKTALVDCSEFASSFANVNTREELRQLDRNRSAA